MKWTKLGLSRLIVGILLIAIAVLMFLFTELTTAGIIAIGILGLISVAISRKV